jgi:hypothetical protein
MYVDTSFPPSKRDPVSLSQPTPGPQLRPQLNDFFELALDFLAACYLSFGCRANRLYVRVSAHFFGLDLLALLRFLFRPRFEEPQLVAHGTHPSGVLLWARQQARAWAGPYTRRALSPELSVHP